MKTLLCNLTFSLSKPPLHICLKLTLLEYNEETFFEETESQPPSLTPVQSLIHLNLVNRNNFIQPWKK